MEVAQGRLILDIDEHSGPARSLCKPARRALIKAGNEKDVQDPQVLDARQITFKNGARAHPRLSQELEPLCQALARAGNTNAQGLRIEDNGQHPKLRTRSAGFHIELSCQVE